MEPRIFVSIAAYRDPELQLTLRSLFARAAAPERISVRPSTPKPGVTRGQGRGLSLARLSISVLFFFSE